MYRHGKQPLCPPPNFALVEKGVYRSGYPSTSHVPFLKHIGIRTIVLLSIEMLPGPVVAAIRSDAMANVPSAAEEAPVTAAAVSSSMTGNATHWLKPTYSIGSVGDLAGLLTEGSSAGGSFNSKPSGQWAAHVSALATSGGSAGAADGVGDVKQMPASAPAAAKGGARERHVESGGGMQMVQVATFSSWLDFGWTTDEFCVENIVEALDYAVDAQYHPVLLTCPTGELQTSVVVGCMRKYQEWTLSAILCECELFANMTCEVRPSVSRFIERWSVEEFPISEVDTMGRAAERLQREARERMAIRRRDKRRIKAGGNGGLVRPACDVTSSSGRLVDGGGMKPRIHVHPGDSVSTSDEDDDDDDDIDDTLQGLRLSFEGGAHRLSRQAPRRRSPTSLSTSFTLSKHPSFLDLANVPHHQNPRTSQDTLPARHRTSDSQFRGPGGPMGFAVRRLGHQPVAELTAENVGHPLVPSVGQGSGDHPGEGVATTWVQETADAPAIQGLPMKINRSFDAAIETRPKVPQVRFAEWYVKAMERIRTRHRRTDQLRQKLQHKLQAAVTAAVTASPSAKRRESMPPQVLAPHEIYAMVRNPPAIDARSSFKKQSIVEEDDD